MSATVHLLEQLQKTDLLIERLHQEIAEKPNSLSLQATLMSLEKRHRKLEKDLIFEMESQRIENSNTAGPSKEEDHHSCEVETGAGRLLQGVEPRLRDTQ